MDHGAPLIAGKWGGGDGGALALRGLVFWITVLRRGRERREKKRKGRKKNTKEERSFGVLIPACHVFCSNTETSLQLQV